MAFGDETSDIKANAHTRERRCASSPPDERLTEVGQILGRDPYAVVGDPDLGRPVQSVEGDADLTAGRRVLHRVANEIHEELLEPRLVAANRKPLRRLDLESVPTLLL